VYAAAIARQGGSPIVLDATSNESDRADVLKAMDGAYELLMGSDSAMLTRGDRAWMRGSGRHRHAL